jgi:hypothetical protein
LDAKRTGKMPVPQGLIRQLPCALEKSAGPVRLPCSVFEFNPTIGSMVHRHLNHEGDTLAAIDDVIARGGRQDWEQLRRAVLESPELLGKIRGICQEKIVDPYAQRYHFWMNYVSQ